MYRKRLPFKIQNLNVEQLKFFLYLLVEQNGGDNKPKWWPDNIEFEHPIGDINKFELMEAIRKFYKFHKDKSEWLRELYTYIKVHKSDDTKDDSSEKEENTIDEEENTIDEEENAIDEEENIINEENGSSVENLNKSISLNNSSNLKNDKSSDYNKKEVKLFKNKSESPDNNTKHLTSSINESESLDNKEILTSSISESESSDSNMENLPLSIEGRDSSDLKLSIKESELKQLMPAATVQLYDVVRYGTNEKKEDFLLTLNLLKNDILSKLNLLKYRKRLRKTGQVPRSSLTIKKDLQRFKNKSSKTILKEQTFINDQNNIADKPVTTSKNKSENGISSFKFYNLSAKSFNKTNKENDITNHDDSSQILINNSVSPNQIKKSAHKSSQISNVQTLDKNISIQGNKSIGRKSSIKNNKVGKISLNSKNSARLKKPGEALRAQHLKNNKMCDSSVKENSTSGKDLKNIFAKNKNNSELNEKILKQPVSSTPIKSTATLSVHQVVPDLNSDLSEKAEIGKKENKKSFHQKKERRKSISMNTAPLDLNLSNIESVQTGNDKLEITPDKSNQTLQSSPNQQKRKSVSFNLTPLNFGSLDTSLKQKEETANNSFITTFSIKRNSSKMNGRSLNMKKVNVDKLKENKRLKPNSPKKFDSKNQNIIKKYFSPTKKFSSPQQLKLNSLKELCKPCFVLLETNDRINRSSINQVSQVILLENNDLVNVEPISNSSATETISQTKISKSNDKGFVSNFKEIDKNTTKELIDLVQPKEKIKAKTGRYSDPVLFKKPFSKQKKRYSLVTKNIKKNKPIKIKWPTKLMNLSG